VPGLQILRIDRIEQSAIPLCLAWYPKSDTEKFFMISNSEVIILQFRSGQQNIINDSNLQFQYKYKIFSDATKEIRGTYLGPIFKEPVKHFQVMQWDL